MTGCWPIENGGGSRVKGGRILIWDYVWDGIFVGTNLVKVLWVAESAGGEYRGR